MANIKVVSEFPLFDGMAITFNAPCECSAVDGLTVTYSGESQSFTFRDAHGNDLTGIGNLFSEGARVKVILDTVNNMAFIQNADTNKYIEDTFVKIVSPVYTANPENLMEVIASAQAGATVQLEDGIYPLLVLKGQKAYRQNLTITGSKEVKIAGISVTSGVENDKQLWESDVSHITLPGGLTIRDVTLTDSFCLRNACIDGLRIINVHITSGGINIYPDSYKDKYGIDGAGVTEHRYSFQGAIVKNLLIKGCTIDDANIENNDTNHAIYIKVAENITIQGNNISAARNGIQIAGASDRPVCGNIRICDNEIPKSTEAAIRISSLKNAYLSVVHNKITNCKMSGTVDKTINITGCKDTTYQFCRRESDGYNTADGKKINVGDGIFIAEVISGERKSIQKSGDWIVAINDNYKECWGTVSCRLEYTSGVSEFVLPFLLKDHHNIQITMRESYNSVIVPAQVIAGSNSVYIEFLADIDIDVDVEFDVYCMTW